MSNNTSNYQEYTFPKLLDQYDKILVPMIQRDYAQGRTDKKATDVRNNLLTDIFSGNEVHFDLVFGSKEGRSIDGKEMNCFIPIDGQQRLTTLFLLHLYGQKAGKTNTELNLSKFSYDTRRAASDFCKSITSEEWAISNDENVSDVIKDSSWFMNYWEKDPTVEGMLNMLDAIHEKCREITDYPNLNKVTFFFFDLESNGLNENLYLKMNSRGKPLTAFENLKAEMEKILPENVEFEDKCFPNCDASPKDSFKAKWKYFMDRNWTEAFWDKEHPENNDESITKFIVRFLAGYWAAYGTDEEQMANDLKSLNSKDIYADFIPFEPVKKVLEKENAFSSLAYALTTVPKIDPYWTNDTIKVSDKSEYKFLAIVFTHILFDSDESAKRFAWNMSENYVTGYDTFAAYCKRAKEIHDKFSPDKNYSFYKMLSDNGIANPSDQLKEEIAKAKQILNGGQRTDGKTWEEIIIEAERYAFFKGAIRFLFTKEKIEDDWEHFDTKWDNAQKYFDANGVKEEYRKNAYLLRYYISQFKEWWMFWNFPYDNETSTWKSILISNRFAANHRVLMQMPKDSDLLNLSNFVASLEKYDDGYKDLQNNVQNDLVKTTILVEASKWHSKLNWRYNTYSYSLYPHNAKAEWKKYVIGNHRNHILSRLCDSGQIVVDGNRRFQSGDSNNFFWGWNINFKYKDHFFQWWGYPNEKELDVYLMENDWADYKKRPNPLSDKGPDEDKYYCFRVTKEMESDPTKFTNALDSLINEATNNEQTS